MFLLQIIGCVVLVFCFASGLDPIDTCSDEYREDFSCFFQQNYNTETQQKGIKFCTLNKFTCLVNQPMTYSHHCPKKQTNPENNWQCYSRDPKPMSYSILPTPGETENEWQKTEQVPILLFNGAGKVKKNFC